MSNKVDEAQIALFGADAAAHGDFDASAVCNIALYSSCAKRRLCAYALVAGWIADANAAQEHEDAVYRSERALRF